MTKELTTIRQDNIPVNIIDRPLSVEGIKARVNFIKEVRKSIMEEKIHYGIVPGSPKPTLLKPGAEILLHTFRIAPRINKEEIIELKNNHREYRYIIEAISIDGAFLGQAVATASTEESKYAFRNASRVCPTCNKEAIIKGKEEYGGGWLCYKNKGGCGAKFDDNDTLITSQPVGKIANEHLADVYNTVQKMAYKRAVVALALIVTGASSDFTQDLEDMQRDKDNLPTPDNTSSNTVDVTYNEIPPNNHDDNSSVRQYSNLANPALIARLKENLTVAFPNDPLTQQATINKWLGDDNLDPIHNMSELDNKLTSQQAQKYTAMAFDLAKTTKT